MTLAKSLAFRDKLLEEKKNKQYLDEITILKNYINISNKKKELENQQDINNLYILDDIYKQTLNKLILFKLQKIEMLNNLIKYLYKNNNINDINDINDINHINDLYKLVKNLKKQVYIYKKIIS